MSRSTEKDMAPTFIGVGVGPGDPGLVTLKAVAVLRAADRVFGPTMASDAVGRAESIVSQVAPEVRVERLVFAILRDEAARGAAHEAAAEQVVACLEADERVAFVTLGDPNVYSTFHHLAALVCQRLPATVVETVPGIMAFQDVAARRGAPLLDGSERLHLVSAVDGPEVLDVPLADADAAVVIYKGGRHVPAIADRLERAGRLDDAVLGELLGLPGERVVPLKEAAGDPAAYLASVVVPPGRTTWGGRR
ncbi:MAG: precorrin-2 C(20)-methyltransferase [Actinomycetota bacterium]|jgi:precorrin-2/cobalt-factor-2 C20-methyltransferase|nr:precorrin-2 C(20)-methyltransferase [Actinomycetota bacterium]